MTTIDLKPETIQTYMNLEEERKFNGCKEIQSIFCREDTPSQLIVEAQIPSLSPPFTPYTICVIVEKDGSVIHRTSCNCPVGSKCKHINKVLQRIVDSTNNPILKQQPSRKRKADTSASVYIAFAYEYFEYADNLNNGSDLYCIDESEGYEILGVFLSKRAANRCAKERAYPLDEPDEDEDDDDSLDIGLFEFCDDDPTEGFDRSDMTFEKVWVECRTIEDASPEFHI
jgi:hypothetical protein